MMDPGHFAELKEVRDSIKNMGKERPWPKELDEADMIGLVLSQQRMLGNALLLILDELKEARDQQFALNKDLLRMSQSVEHTRIEKVEGG